MKPKTKKTLMWVGGLGALALIGYFVIKGRDQATAAPTPIAPAPPAPRAVTFFKAPT